MEFYANLHLHSTHSDGVYTPEELVVVAKKEGYGALAIADHDTATAYPELLSACQKHDMECILATEFTTKVPMDTHIVGMDFDPDYPAMKQYLSDMAEACVYTTKGCFDEAVELGNISDITWEEVLSYNQNIRWLCNNHVFRAMKAKGLVDESQYYEWYVENFRYKKEKYKADMEFLTIPQIIDLIHKSGGIAFLAHPADEHIEIIDKFLEWGIDGIEASYSTVTPERAKRIFEIAQKHNLYISGGSDHSGLCGGLYSSFSTEEALKNSDVYIEEHSIGVTYEHFSQIKKRQKSVNEE